MLALRVLTTTINDLVDIASAHGMTLVEARAITPAPRRGLYLTTEQFIAIEAVARVREEFLADHADIYGLHRLGVMSPIRTTRLVNIGSLAPTPPPLALGGGLDDRLWYSVAAAQKLASQLWAAGYRPHSRARRTRPAPEPPASQ